MLNHFKTVLGIRNAHSALRGGDVQTLLAVTLASFGAETQAGHVSVTWETVDELDNQSFNLYRSDSANSPRALLASIPSQAPGSTQGFAYTYADLAVQPGQTYWYWLETVSLSGATALHGPVSATASAPTAVTLASLQAAPAAPVVSPALAGLAAMAALAIATLNRRRR